ncbi:MAG: nitrite reductase (NAD(P)H) small subunit [Acidobacteria bacterium]|nr:nitrite reductase (NAD(P)H) small subunit [Acidobacteriota bacterium]
MVRDAMAPELSGRYLRVAQLADVQGAECVVVHVKEHTLALFSRGEHIYAVDNRCPHMGFPLNRGTVKEGILTCHWHHARFDLASGGTFDQWADDVPVFPVQIRNGEVWVDLSPRGDAGAHQRQRLRDGLERNIPLVVGKAVIRLLDEGVDPVEPFRIGLDFGIRYRQTGWGQGLTILACIMNLLPHLDAEDRPRALYHGLSAVARDCAGLPPRFGVHPLPALPSDFGRLKQWFRQFVEVRDAEGAERCIVSAVRAGADHRQMAELLFAAATDHRYIQIGHVADFTNKALEALDRAGWEHAEPVLASLVSSYTNADRMEESNAWRHPVDLVAILERSFEELPAALANGPGRQGSWKGRDALVTALLGEDPQAIADGLLAALQDGSTEEELAGTVAYAAALRIARFHTSNEFGDWDRALHTFTFANAVHQGLRRVRSPELLRGIFDAAMSVYLDRFLNLPAARLPEPEEDVENPEMPLAELSALLDRQQQVNEAGEVVARYLSSDGEPARLLAVLGKLLLREDRDFHTIQTVEAAYRQYEHLRGTPAGTHVLVAAARCLAAHSPTVREQGQTYQIAYRLHRGDRLFEES